MQDSQIENDNFNNNQIPSTPPYQGGRPPLGRGQKIAAIALAIFAVLAIGLWMAQFKKSLSEPFAYKGEENGAETSGSSQQNEEEALKNKDTDKDGLSDWDELNIYKTSPYLEDSDSDGFSDKKEIDSDNDPNCPTGRKCYEVGVVEGDKAITTEGQAGNGSQDAAALLNQLGAGGGLNISTTTANLENVLGGQSDAAALRKMLSDAGMDQNLLSQISDEDLMKAYEETLNK